METNRHYFFELIIAFSLSNPQQIEWHRPQTMLKKRLHNHNNNQTNPKKQPYTKNKPTTNILKNRNYKKTHNNNQRKTKNTKPASHIQLAPFYANTCCSSIEQKL